MATVDSALTEIAADLTAALTAARVVASNPPEQAGAFPLVVVHLAQGVFEESPAGVLKGLHTITIEVHVTRVGKGLARAHAELRPYVDSVPDALFDGHVADRFNSTVDTFGTITYTVQPSQWDSTDTLAAVFNMTQVKIQATR